MWAWQSAEAEATPRGPQPAGPREEAIGRRVRYLPQNGLPNFLFEVQSIKPLHFQGHSRGPGQVEARGVQEIPLLHTDLRGESWGSPGLGTAELSPVVSCSSSATSPAGKAGSISSPATSISSWALRGHDSHRTPRPAERGTAVQRWVPPSLINLSVVGETGP